MYPPSIEYRPAQRPPSFEWRSILGAAVCTLCLTAFALGQIADTPLLQYIQPKLDENRYGGSNALRLSPSVLVKVEPPASVVDDIRSRILAHARSKLDQLTEQCGLSDAQLEKMQVAVLADTTAVCRRLREMETKYSGLETITASDLTQISEEFSELSSRITLPWYPNTLSAKVLQQVLNQQQAELYLIAQLSQTADVVNRFYAINSEQRKQLISQLAEEFEADTYALTSPEIGRLLLAKLDTQKLASFLSPDQIAAINQLQKQYRLYFEYQSKNKLQDLGGGAVAIPR
ncbi:MAG: hypothetical protein KDB03_07625 [Planctomycetales bacterium]|nr:hypothetical protein [Planctomycetales bacterium]